jgi:hypothetical protein
MRTKLSVRGDRYEVVSLRRPLSTSEKSRLFNAHVVDSLPFGQLRASDDRLRWASPSALRRPLSITAALLLVGMLSQSAAHAQSSVTSVSVPRNLSASENGTGVVTVSNAGQTCTATCTVTSGSVQANASSSNIAVDLPASDATFNPVKVCKSDSSAHTVTVTPNGTDTINGAASLVLSNLNQCVELTDAAVGNWSVNFNIGADLNASGQVTSAHLASPLPVVQGGTAASSAGATAAHNIGAAAEGANSDITSLTGLTTPLSVSQGGTGATSGGATAAGNIGALAVSNNLSDLPSAPTARTNLGLGGAATVSTPISVTNGGTGASSAGATAAHNIGAAAEGANSDITSLTGLTTPLSVAQGGTACPQTGTLHYSKLPSSPVLGTTCTIVDCQTGVSGTVETGGGSVTCQVAWMGASWIDGGVASKGSGSGGGVGLPPQQGAEAYYASSSSPVVSGLQYVIHAGSGTLASAFGHCPQNTWQASYSYSPNNEIEDSNGNTEEVTTPGTSGSTAPSSWATTVGSQTTDGTVTWTMVMPFADAPAANCTIWADNGYTYNVDRLIVGATDGSVQATLMVNGANITANGTAGAGDAGLIETSWGHILGTGRGMCQMNQSYNSNLDAILESMPAYASRLPNNPFKVQGTNWDFQDCQVAPSSTATLNESAVWISAVAGLGFTKSVTILSGQSGGTGLLVDDGAYSGMGSNNLLFDGTWVEMHSGSPTSGPSSAYGAVFKGRQGGIYNIQWIGGSVADGGSGSIAHWDFDGDGSSGLITGVAIVGPYCEVQPGESSADCLYLSGALGVTLSSFVCESAGGTAANCVHIANGADQIWVNGRNTGGGATDAYTNSIDSKVMAGNGAFNYFYSKSGQGPVFDGLGSQSADATTQTANVSSTTIYSVPSSSLNSGVYKASCYVVETTAATTSSTMPSCAVAWTDNDSGTSESATLTSTSAANTVGTLSQGQQIIDVAANSSVKYLTSAYASSGATPMQYAVHFRLDRVQEGQ